MNIKYIKLSKKCRHHSGHRLGSLHGCLFCKRALAHNSLLSLSPEEILLREIFGNRRYIKQTQKQISPKYKGKRPIL